MTDRILCVCLGNICRSPTAEGVLRARLPDHHIDSAGTGDWHIGKPPYGPAQAAALTRGYDLSGLRARQVSRADFHRFDLILAMDSENHADLARMAPEGARAALAMYLDPLGGGDVPDPYFTRDFEGALDLIEQAAHLWAARLRGASG
ncbi:Low molecular weight protein tyrosine phosphatase [Roseibacterium elongatum DSM 19469]|uniref:protein-tyrosine-phosphatase n=1 Tax=Roseicyclus elongatus DSM 19469 TaxID=1294273 RepID=W8RSK5_9RHOB|nr:low molecular weight protein-tyrosine-phosphatase [Roseibacterium elongatum]AHM04179.1 Low molecular weight protein tyrosine phosphatase [Roseibacterium elongatum DSM 19469]